MGMHDRDWYKEKYQKNAHNKHSGHAWSQAERNQWQSKLDAASSKGRYNKLGKNIALFVILSISGAVAIKALVGKDGFSLQTISETLGLGRVLGTAPDGTPWPEATGYLPGHPVLATQGRGSITIDNRNGNEDVFVQILDGTNTVRQAYVNHNDKFELTAVTPGSYELKVLKIQSGIAYRIMEPITLSVTRDGNSTSWGSTTIRLNSKSEQGSILSPQRISRAGL
ncbi:MAG: hypothetical protein GX782_11290 [Gammaproteobacteria bacterium]|nr:hypothetical protein [Gammaproteobacteria bacterium]